DWAPLAESDPVPGDPDELDRLVGQLRATATAIEQAAADLRTLAGVDGWRGQAADKFREQAREVAGSIERAFDRYDVTASALGEYSGALRTEQDNSVRALTDAQTAAEDVRLAEAAMEGRTDVDAPDYLAHEQAVTDGGVALAEARRKLGLAVEARDEAARTAKSKIQNVVEDDGLTTGFWGRVGDAIL
nr:hypothetical protein [Micromonospora sp. DSM 115978]